MEPTLKTARRFLNGFLIIFFGVILIIVAEMFKTSALLGLAYEVAAILSFGMILIGAYVIVLTFKGLTEKEKSKIK
jgi:membrane protein implicated in regulation of membrane protease activity